MKTKTRRSNSAAKIDVNHNDAPPNTATTEATFDPNAAFQHAQPDNDDTPVMASPEAVVTVPQNEIVVVEPTFESPPPPTHAPLKGASFSSVVADVMTRADSMLPDRVVHVADLRMTPTGHIALPGGTELSMNPWARKQLASMLGLRWETWFRNASGEERAEEVNRRFQRTPGEKKIRAWKDPDSEAHGIARAFLAPTFTPIDDARIFERMNVMMRGLVDEYRFTSVQFTDTTTHYTAVHMEPFSLDGDLLHPGFHLRNSEVGASALSLDDHWLRLVCTNGLMVRVGGRRSLYRTHRAIEDDQLAAALVIAVGRLPERWKTTFAWMQSAKQIAVPHPDDAVAAILGDSAEIPQALLEEAQRVVLREGDASRFGVVQAITLVAHTKSDDPDVRFAMERLAGDYLAAPHTIAE